MKNMNALFDISHFAHSTAYTAHNDVRDALEKYNFQF